MGTEYRQTHAETAERYFTCRYCGAKGEVAFRAKGDSGWHREGLFESDGAERAHEAAQHALMTDAERVLHLIKCPTCKRRDARYVRWAVIRVVAWLVIALLVYLFAAEYFAVTRDVPVWLPPLVPVVIACVQAFVEGSRWRRADRAQILKLKPGTRATPSPAPIVKPIIKPVVAKPVEKIEQRGPDDEPAFLRKHD